MLIGNTGGDRLIDWVGEFNSYLVPFAPFGMATVSRTLQPQLPEFLYALSASDGADPTRAGDDRRRSRRATASRTASSAWSCRRTSPGRTRPARPRDPQAGNIPGGKRDVLRSADFNDGTRAGLRRRQRQLDGRAAARCRSRPRRRWATP